MKTQEERRQALVELCAQHGLETEQREHYRTSADEDIAEYLHDGKFIGEYVAVTSTDEFVYLYPCLTVAEAQRRAIENIDDTMYPEAPRQIVDLDEGREMYVRQIVVEWRDWSEAKQPC